MTAPVKRRLEGPPGFRPELYTAKLRHGAFRTHTQECINKRRDWCRTSPILFALYYLAPHVMLPGMLHALSDLHIALAMSAKRWMRTDVGPKEIRDAWVAPRDAAKTTWLFLILPLWSMAFGHRKFIVVYSDTEDQAKLHLATLKLQFAQNERLMRDFPELCTPMKTGGRALKDNDTTYLAANGAIIMVKGMNSATLGVKWDNLRPDALLFDEVEPKKGRYNVEMKRKRLEDLIDVILPCNFSAVVQIAGTTVMAGSIIHNLVEGDAWVAEENITVHHFRGIIEDPETGDERSLWEPKWSLEFQREERLRNPRGYAKNFDNAPVDENGTFWDDDDITYDTRLLEHITERILVVDPASKSKKTNDETGIAMVSYAGNVRRVIVERVMGVRLKPDKLRELVHSIVRNNGIRLIVVDVTNGGDHVENTLSPLPPGVRVFPVSLRRSKIDRITDLHDCYLRKPPMVVHARPISTLEAQMKAYPKTLHDDQIDAVALGKEYFHGELKAAS